MPSRPSTTSLARPQAFARANLLQLPGLFGINRNGCSASAETTVRLRPKSVYDFVRNCRSPLLRNGCSFSPVIHNTTTGHAPVDIHEHRAIARARRLEASFRGSVPWILAALGRLQCTDICVMPRSISQRPDTWPRAGCEFDPCGVHHAHAQGRAADTLSSRRLDFAGSCSSPTAPRGLSSTCAAPVIDHD